ncbi:MAG TPA: hypothetical protein VMW52_12250, partial [Phycisphaerae bacterium]|nr:hypothetical protein [Phycisphaerae bacterium]
TGKLVSGARHYIPNAIEYGHAKRGGGTVAARSYLRTAFDATKNQALQTVNTVLDNGIARAYNSAG